MKKYEKPAILFESFTLSARIASCDVSVVSFSAPPTCAAAYEGYPMLFDDQVSGSPCEFYNNGKPLKELKRKILDGTEGFAIIGS